MEKNKYRLNDEIGKIEDGEMVIYPPLEELQELNQQMADNIRMRRTPEKYHLPLRVMWWSSLICDLYCGDDLIIRLNPRWHQTGARHLKRYEVETDRMWQRSSKKPTRRSRGL